MRKGVKKEVGERGSKERGGKVGGGKEGGSKERWITETVEGGVVWVGGGVTADFPDNRGEKKIL